MPNALLLYALDDEHVAHAGVAVVYLDGERMAEV